MVRTEFKGISGKIKAHSIYLRVWLGKRVYILDSREGYKQVNKHRSAFKLIVGICAELEEGES